MENLEENKNQIENNEAVKPIVEVVAEKEISPEEFSIFLDSEGKNFKEETADEIKKLNSVDLDQSTFEKIKNEFGIEQQLNSLEQEVDQLIAEAKQTAAPVNSYSVIAETVDYFINNAFSENKDQDVKFKEAERLITKIQNANEEILKADKKSKENTLQEDIEREDDIEMKEILQESTHIEPYADPVLQNELFLKQYENDTKTVFRDVLKKLYSEDMYVERSDRERIFEKVQQHIKEIYENKFPNSFPVKQEESQVKSEVVKDVSKDNVENLDESEENREIDIGVENVVINTESFEMASFGRLLSEFSPEQQNQYEESVKKYGSVYEEIKNDPDFYEIKNAIASEYGNTMNRLGIESSAWGNTDKWIVWDIAKQKYFSEHPEESSSDYKIADPLGPDNQEILKEIVDRHIGWELVGYAKNNPNFVDTLDKNKDSYNKILSLVQESQEKSKLHSYQLTELGKLIQENKL